MLTLTAGQLAALAAGRCVRRTFIWCEPRDPSSPGVVGTGFWDDLGIISVAGRSYNGSGTLARVESLSAKSDASIPNLVITLSGISPSVNNAVRAKDVSQARIEVAIGVFDPVTRAVIDGLIPRFVGVIDGVEIRTPVPLDSSEIIFTCESVSRALTIRNTQTRSTPTQKERSATDKIFDYCGQQRERTIYFGRREPNADKKGKKG